MNKTQIFLLITIFSALFFIVGYKFGDARGYEDGYNEGYRYDCKDEIGLIYKQVKSQSVALDYTDSVIRVVQHENDSLKNKEYYQKRHEDSLMWRKAYSKDSVKFSVRARLYSDSINRVVGGSFPLIQDDGNVNVGLCMLSAKYKSLKECQPGGTQYVRNRLGTKPSKKKGR